MLKKRAIGGAMACALGLNCLLAVPFGSAAAETKFEFEDGTQTGSATVLSEQSGYSGSGYVFLKENTDTVSVTVTAPATGMYDLSIGYAAVYGDKVQGLEVNGENQGNVSFPEGSTFEELKFGTVMLKEGENTVTIVGSWGWTLFDYVTIAEAEVEELHQCNILSDPNATAEAQGLMNYMADMYGEYIVSGQQEIYGGGHGGNYEWEFDYLYDLTGEYPAIRGFDYLNTNPMCGWDDGTTERIIEWVNERGGIATTSWHLIVPTDFASYELGSTVAWSEEVCTHNTNTDFKVANIVNDTSSKEYKYFMQSVEMLAAELKQLQDAGVPLLFRPLHEAEGAGGETGSWFWWGMDGSNTYKELWKLLYTTLTEEYGIHNLIWEFNSYTYGKSMNWYPGNEYVDLVGYDKYNASANNPNESAISSTFNGLVDMYNKYGKMVAMMECDTIPSVENMTAENAYWLYFCPWYEDNGAKFLTEYNNADTLTSIYQSDVVVTLDELPDYKSYVFTGEEYVPETMPPTEPTQPTEPVKEGHAKVVEEEDYTALIFPGPVGESFFIEVEFANGVDNANGGIGAGSMIGDTYYWANISWEATAPGVVEVDTDNFYNVTTSDGTAVTDEAIIAQLAEILKTEVTTFQAQVWYAGEGAEAASKSDVTFVDAWLADADPGTTDPDETPEPTDPPADEDIVEGTVKESTDGYAITLPQAVGETLYLQVELASGVTYANGCVATNVDVDGTSYWVSVQWEATKSGDIEVDMTKVFNVTLDNEEVTDEAILAAAYAGLLEQKNLTGQIWWVNDASGEEVDSSEAVITGAYIKAAAADTEAAYGDVNEDGDIDVLDIIVLNKYLLGGGSLTDQAQLNADVDGDGEAGANDSLNIMKYIVKLLDKLPVTTA